MLGVGERGRVFLSTLALAFLFCSPDERVAGHVLAEVQGLLSVFSRFSYFRGFFFASPKARMLR